VSALVNFPWYDLPELNQLHDQLWLELKYRLASRGLRDLPKLRQTNVNHDMMLLSDQLLITQTCGFDVATQVPRKVCLIAAPTFNLVECPQGHYYSYLLSHKKKLGSQASVSINDSRSWSGCHALLKYCKDREIEIDWATSCFSGSHRESLKKLLRKEVHVAAIDAVTLTLYSKHVPNIFDQLSILGRTLPIPAPPYVTSLSNSTELVGIVFEELQDLVRTSPWIQENLLLLDLLKVSRKTYEECQQNLFLDFHGQTPILDRSSARFAHE